MKKGELSYIITKFKNKEMYIKINKEQITQITKDIKKTNIEIAIEAFLSLNLKCIYFLNGIENQFNKMTVNDSMLCLINAISISNT